MRSGQQRRKEGIRGHASVLEQVSTQCRRGEAFAKCGAQP
jgi:hypothetical protein